MLSQQHQSDFKKVQDANFFDTSWRLCLTL